jgi:hypothetical protein
MLGATNEEVMVENGEVLWRAVEDRLTRQRDMAEEIKTMTPEQLVQNGIVDPVKIFIKKEPHSAKKVASGMFRIIASVSLCDQLCERLTCERQNKLEILGWKQCPSKPGMGLNDEGLAILRGNAERILDFGRIMATDVSSWDWTVQQWELLADARIRIKLAGESETSSFGKILLSQSYGVSQSVYITSGGQMFAQTVPGGQLSGRYNTSSSNSRMRVLATLAGRLKINPALLDEYRNECLVVSMGDDTFELEIPGLEKEIASIGHLVKQVDYHDSVVRGEFCSQVFDEEAAAPTDPAKTVFRYLSHPVDAKDYPAYLVQLRWCMRHLKGEVRDTIERLGLNRVERLRNLSSEISVSLSNENAVSTI